MSAVLIAALKTAEQRTWKALESKPPAKGDKTGWDARHESIQQALAATDAARLALRAGWE